MYKRNKTCIVKDSKLFIPIDPLNKDYREFQEWVKQGNIAETLPDYVEGSDDPMLRAAIWLNEQSPEIISALVAFVQRKGQP